MKYEYLLLIIIIISGPLTLSFDRKVNFRQYWRFVFPAILFVAVPFLIWDAVVTGRHWWFSEQYTSGIRLLGLPLAEWLFFIVAPYACIFTWEVLRAYFGNRRYNETFPIRLLLSLIFILSSPFIFYIGIEYTAIVFFTMGIALILDVLFKNAIFLQSRTYWLMLLSVFMMLIFNGYLTARPVVLYDPAYQLDWRIGTIPGEDFFYGFSLIFLNIIIYEKLKGRQYG